MRVFSCKCHAPLFCCSKSSIGHSSPCPPQSKPGDAENVLPSPPPTTLVLEKDLCEEKGHVEQKSVDDGEVEISPKSSIKKPGGSCLEKACKGNVKWMDMLGKELVEIKEFEPTECEESDNEIDGNTSCVCSIQ